MEQGEKMNKERIHMEEQSKLVVQISILALSLDYKTLIKLRETLAERAKTPADHASIMRLNALLSLIETLKVTASEIRRNGN